MAINHVEIKDFLVFKGKFTADFCNGVNILIGGNGTGKNTMMKALYWACEFIDKSVQKNQVKSLQLDQNQDSTFAISFLPIDYFGRRIYAATPDDSDKFASKLQVSEFTNGEIEPALNVSVAKSLEKVTLYYGDVDSKERRELYLWFNRESRSVFIPTTEMLSHSCGFLALNRERPVPFDKTEIDIISKAELEPTREITQNAAKVLEKIASVIGGTVSFDGKDFYVEKSIISDKVPFSFEASGYRKLGLLWKLLRNGLLESGSILFWDEPENSLNPELVPILVDILLELSKNDVQIFIATHDYNLARYFDVRKDKSIPVVFHNLSITNNGQIICNSSPEYVKIPGNHLETASANLFKAVVTDAMEIQGDE